MKHWTGQMTFRPCPSCTVHSGRLEETLASSGQVANVEAVLGDVPRSWEIW